MIMIDILLATYNGGPYLREQLDSLFKQTYTGFRLIVRDDGSEDSTKEILREYLERYLDKVELILDERPTGSARGNFFRLLEFSNADYTMFCDQDDVWLPDKISRTLDAMCNAEEEYGDIPLAVHTDLSVTDNDMHMIDASLFHMQRLNGAYNTLNRLIAQNNTTGCTMMINKKLRETVRQGEHMLMHDWWIGITAAAFGRIEFLPEPTVLYRQHDENEVGAKDVMSTAYIRGKLGDREGIRKLIADTYVQADSFLTTYEDMLDDGQKKMLREYINLHYYNMGKRFHAMQKYKFFKSGLIRKMGQIVFG